MQKGPNPEQTATKRALTQAERMSLVGLNPLQLKLLPAAKPLIEPHIDAIIDQFYRHILGHEHLRRIVESQTTVDRLKKTFRTYIEQLFSGQYGEEYHRNRIVVGVTHHRVQLSLAWYLSMFGHLEQLIKNSLYAHFQNRPAHEWVDIQSAIENLIRFDQLLAVDAYVETYTEDLRDQTRLAKEARSARERFLAKASHELRTPLSSIMGYADLILDNAAEISPQTRKHLQVMQRNATNLLSMINGLIEIGRTGGVRWEVTPTLGSATTLLDDIAIAAEGLIGQRPIHIIKNYDASAYGMVFLDFGKIRQVLLNLVSNACKYTDVGQIVLSCIVHHDSVEFGVEDTGPGIPVDERERIFEEFYRIPRDAIRGITGSGLGLALVKTIVHNLGGTLNIRDSDPHGACFTVRLPRSFQDASQGSF